jgi:hypothetical protein
MGFADPSLFPDPPRVHSWRDGAPVGGRAQAVSGFFHGVGTVAGTVVRTLDDRSVVSAGWFLADSSGRKPDARPLDAGCLL